MFQKSALDLWRQECGQRPIITGSQRLDQAIGNGVPAHVITEFCGPPGSGKTQLCLQLCVNVQIPVDLGGLDGSAVYIDTSHGFSPHRLREIACACVDHLKRVQSRNGAAPEAAVSDHFTADRILDRVLCTYASSAAELLAAVHHLRQLLASSNSGSSSNAPVRLIVIDSLAAVFRDHSGSNVSSSNGGLKSIDRIRVLYDLMADLEALARRHQCAVVLTNEITTRLSERDASSSCSSWLVPALGETHGHRVGQLVALGRDESSDGGGDGSTERFVARVTKSLSCPVSSVLFKDQLADILLEYTHTTLNLDYEHVCGVPYTALPIATLMSVKRAKPMLIRRKEAKGYGTKKLIEGKFAAADRCLIVEDVITSGSSILETVHDLRSEGIAVTDAVVVVDREQGAAANIALENVRVHSLFALSYLLSVLHEAGKIEASMVAAVNKFVADSQCPPKPAEVAVAVVAEPAVDRTRLTFEARQALATNAVGRRLFGLMATKQTNLCVAADLTTSAAILDLADAIGPFICVLKTHVDIVTDYTPAFVASLRALAAKHRFLLMEDRKFADIGNTVALQYAHGVYRIADWADLVTVHALPGAGILQGLQSVRGAQSADVERGVFLLAELSSAGNLCTAEYASAAVAMAAASPLVAGIVGQQRGLLAGAAGLVQLTPGVRIDEAADALGQQYDTPEAVVLEKGADVAVVGRGVYEAKNAAEAAKLYRDRLWAAYEKRVAGGEQ